MAGAKIITTDRQIATKPLTSSIEEYSVRGHQGLRLRISARKKVFQGRVTKDGKRKKVTLGEFHPTGFTIAMAFKKLNAERIGIADRTDTVIDDILDNYYADTLPGLKRPESIEAIFNKHIRTFLGDKPLSSFKLLAITKEIRRIREQNGKEAARKTLIYMRAFFRWATEEGAIKDNPCAALGQKRFNLSSKPRERVLTRKEVQLLFDALHRSKMDVRTISGIKLLLLLGTRSGELMEAKWAHINLTTAQWLLPVGNTKTKKQLVIPLPRQAVELFAALRPITSKTGMVMGSLSSKVFIRALTRIQSADKSGYTALPLTSKLNLHDLRRSFSTFLNEMGTAPHVVEKMLNHQQQGVAAVYNKASLLTERAKANQTYADALDDPLVLLPEREEFEVESATFATETEAFSDE